MKRRVIALCCALGVLLGCSACRLRADLSATDEDGKTPTPTRPIHNDEMAEEAWKIYSDALKIEEAYTTYDLAYEGKQTVGGETAVTKARIVRVERDGKTSLLVESTWGEEYSMGYFADGIAYFDLKGQQYWVPADEELIYEKLGFSETENLVEAMFADAIVVKNADGSATVSCPLSGEYATQYARMYLGNLALGASVTRAEAGMTVDADGAPTVVTAEVAVQTMMYGTVTVESESRYVAVGDEVTLTPPSDLDSYASGMK